MTPFEDFMYLLNTVLLGDEPSIEDFILLLGTVVAFVAFVLWCFFPVSPRETKSPGHYDARGNRSHNKKFESHYHYEADYASYK